MKHGFCVSEARGNSKVLFKLTKRLRKSRTKSKRKQEMILRRDSFKINAR